MERLNPFEMGVQPRNDRCRQHRHSVFVARAFADQDLAEGGVHGMDDAWTADAGTLSVAGQMTEGNIPVVHDDAVKRGR